MRVITMRIPNCFLVVASCALVACGGEDGSSEAGTQPMPGATTPNMTGAMTPGTGTPPMTPGTGTPPMTPATDTPPMTDPPPATDTPPMTDPPPATDTPTDPPPPPAEGESCAASYGPIGKELTDPTCLDGQYCQKLPDLTVDMSGLLATLDAANTLEARAKEITNVLDAIYPFGNKIISMAEPNCLNSWIQQGMAGGGGGENYRLISLVVHECGHGWDFRDRIYAPKEGVILKKPAKDYFARSEISADEWHNTFNGAAHDLYFTPGAAATDLDIHYSLSEWSQYLHNMVTVYAFEKDRPNSGEEYGIELAMNFAWATQRYMHWARDKYPADYQSMLDDPNFRESVLVLWGQSMLLWDAIEKDTPWSPRPNETRYLDGIRDPKLLEVMNELRVAQGCKGI